MWTGCEAGEEVPIQGYNVNSVGVQDFNGDGVPDLYTTNHNAAPSILLGGREPWRKVPHDPRFPALADLPVEPGAPDAGALLYWHLSHLKIVAGEVAEPVRGSLIFSAEPASARYEGRSDEVRIERVDERGWQVFFTLSTGMKLVVQHEPRIPGWPVRLHMVSDPDTLSIGQVGDHPETDSEFRLRDYHAIVAEDIDLDGDIDLIALGGGMRGRAAELAPDAMEQTFINEGESFTIVDGPPKLGCATRGATWDDGALRVSCAREQPDNLWQWQEGWTGSSDGRHSTFLKPWCSRQKLLQYRVPSFADRSKRRFCVEADFDSDRKDELIVVTWIYPGVSTARRYESSR